MNPLLLLSPAKKLQPIPTALKKTSQPLFKPQIKQLISILKKMTQSDISQLMKLSDKLADLNHTRYQTFNADKYTTQNAHPAIHLFQGDAYQALAAKELNKKNLEYLNGHLLIISGLYGLIRPYDLIQSYRLEMKTSLINASGKDLYAFWQKQLTKKLNQLIQKNKYNLILNCASNEYNKAIKLNELDAPVINCQFSQNKQGNISTIGIYAKKARGLMARYFAQTQPKTITQMQQFNLDGYQFNKKLSTDNHWVFIKKIKDN